MDTEMLAWCGVDCAVCPDLAEGRCPGCRQTDWKPGETCFPVACCREKGLPFCGLCSGFPCADMAEFYRESEGHKQAYARMLSLRKDGGA